MSNTSHTLNNYTLQTHGLRRPTRSSTNCFSSREGINSRCRRFDLLLFRGFGSICRRYDRSCRHSRCRHSDGSLAITPGRSYRPFSTGRWRSSVIRRWFIQLNARASNRVFAIVFFCVFRIIFYYLKNCYTVHKCEIVIGRTDSRCEVRHLPRRSRSKNCHLWIANSDIQI